MQVRPYRPEDYEALKALYQQGDLYGGQFDEARDSKEKIGFATGIDPESILVCEEGRAIVGTLSLIENVRVAWLFRFAVEKSENEKAIAGLLYEKACSILSARGHKQVLLYSPLGNATLDQRYLELGMNKGNPYTCFWREL